MTVLLLFSLLVSTTSIIAVDDTPIATGTIQRSTKQQILATIPPQPTDVSVPFLTSPSGKYTASLLRHVASSSGSNGNDFCYVAVHVTATGQTAWESECAPVSTANACALVFSWRGLEVFDGSTSAWDTDAKSHDRGFLMTLELVDEGDMRIRDKDGELAWRASDDRRVGQHCGAPPALPPFAEPIGQDSRLPFGEPSTWVAQEGSGQQVQLPLPAGRGGGEEEEQPAAGDGGGGGVSEVFGFGGGQPLVDNTPYDSGRTGMGPWIAVVVGLAAATGLMTL